MQLIGLIVGLLALALLLLLMVAILPIGLSWQLLSAPLSVYGDPDWRTPPELEPAYAGERTTLRLYGDGRFEAEQGDARWDGTWSSSAPGPSFGTAAGQLHLQGEEERLAVLRWDGALGFEGELLRPVD